MHKISRAKPYNRRIWTIQQRTTLQIWRKRRKRHLTGQKLVSHYCHLMNNEIYNHKEQTNEWCKDYLILHINGLICWKMSRKCSNQQKSESKRKYKQSSSISVHCDCARLGGRGRGHASRGTLPGRRIPCRRGRSSATHTFRDKRAFQSWKKENISRSNTRITEWECNV